MLSSRNVSSPDCRGADPRPRAPIGQVAVEMRDEVVLLGVEQEVWAWDMAVGYKRLLLCELTATSNIRSGAGKGRQARPRGHHFSSCENPTRPRRRQPMSRVSQPPPRESPPARSITTPKPQPPDPPNSDFSTF